MRLLTSIIGGGLAAAAIGGAFAVPALASPHAAAAHRMTFISVTPAREQAEDVEFPAGERGQCRGDLARGRAAGPRE